MEFIKEFFADKRVKWERVLLAIFFPVALIVTISDQNWNAFVWVLVATWWWIFCCLYEDMSAEALAGWEKSLTRNKELLDDLNLLISRNTQLEIQNDQNRPADTGWFSKKDERGWNELM